jgi:hypothetical protein
MGPRKFHDHELNIPESGNGVPDILDEAAWLPRFCQRQEMVLFAASKIEVANRNSQVNRLFLPI